MSVGFSDLTPEGKRYFAQLEKLSKLEVQVGFQSGDMYDDGTSLAEIAAYNELGTSTSPARPFMKQSFENHEEELKAACKAVNDTIASGGSVEQALNALGVSVKGLVQEEIVDGDFTENALSTIKKKKSEQPLIDTGTMRQSVNFVIKKKGEG